MTRTASSPRCSTSHSRRATPMPCSPVTRAAEIEGRPVELGADASVTSAARGSPRSKTRSGWRLPSPACPKVPMRTSWRPRSPRSRGACPGSAARGHADVLHVDVAQPLQRPVGRAPGLAQPVGLLARRGPGPCELAPAARQTSARRAPSRRARRRRAGRTRSSASRPPRGPGRGGASRRRRAIVNAVQQLEGHRRRARPRSSPRRPRRRTRASGRTRAAWSAAAARAAGAASPP